VPNFAQVRYDDLYPGVDVVFYGKQQQLEYDFIVAPGADAAAIEFTVEGAQALHIDERGDLLIQTATETLRQQRPVIYQEVAGKRYAIAGGYVVNRRKPARHADQFHRQSSGRCFAAGEL
jgi:hypothetical protein